MKNFFNILIFYRKRLLVFLLIASFFIVSYLFLVYNRLSVVSVFPLPNANNVELSVSPHIVFSKPLSEKEQKRIAVATNPSFSFSTYWSSDKKTLVLSTQRYPEANTSYTIVLSGTLSYSWSFKTTGESFINQGQLDYEYNKGLQEFYSSHPWYEKLPPRNDDFFIGFDASKNEFFVDLYPKRSSNLTIEEQTNQLKDRVLQTLRSIGVDTPLYKIVWIVSPR